MWLFYQPIRSLAVHSWAGPKASPEYPVMRNHVIEFSEIALPLTLDEYALCTTAFHTRLRENKNNKKIYEI